VELAVNVMVMAHRREEGNDLARARRRAAGVSPPAANCAGTQETYLRALSTLPGVSIHYGEFYQSIARAYLAHPPMGGPNTVEVIKTEEKGSDVALATYLMLDACRRDCDTAVLITNDSDLREPLRLVRDELGLTTGVINPHPVHRRSRALQATFFKQLQPRALRRSQFPVQIMDAQRRKIIKPVGW
jgi:uncharacterized LabA/DUF88 family protein